MILIVDLCYRERSLSEYEFVEPVAGIVHRSGFPYRILHHTHLTARDLSVAERILLCGTAFRDNAFAERPESFGWLREIRVPVLGICAGMQAMALAFGGTLVPEQEIGMTEVWCVQEDPLFERHPEFTAYGLHGSSVVIPRGFSELAVSSSCVQAMRHDVLPLYGILFHPEVRNEWVVVRFLTMPWRAC